MDNFDHDDLYGEVEDQPSLKRKRIRSRNDKSAKKLINEPSTLEGVNIYCPESHDFNLYLRTLRRYSELVFSSIVQNNYGEWYKIAPTVINEILKFNNIHLKKVTAQTTDIQMYEPMMPVYPSLDELIIFVNLDMFNDYCVARNMGNVSWNPGTIYMSKLNTTKTTPIITLAMVKCAVMCDHVAQHAIHDYYNSNTLECEDPHESYTDYGFTFASVFDIEAICNKSKDLSNVSLNLFNDPVPFTTNNEPVPIAPIPFSLFNQSI